MPVLAISSGAKGLTRQFSRRVAPVESTRPRWVRPRARALRSVGSRARATAPSSENRPDFYDDHLALLAEALVASAVTKVQFDGSMPAEARADLVQHFQVGEVDLSPISLKAGGRRLESNRGRLRVSPRSVAEPGRRRPGERSRAPDRAGQGGHGRAFHGSRNERAIGARPARRKARARRGAAHRQNWPRYSPPASSFGSWRRARTGDEADADRPELLDDPEPGGRNAHARP